MWMNTTPTVANQWNTTVIAPSAGFDNGVITVQVMNTLSAPVDTSTITMMVFVRGAENLEFACPKDLPGTWSQWFPQNDDYDNTAKTQLVISESVPRPIDERYLINMGEKITSLRQVLRRMNFSTGSLTIASATQLARIIITHSRLPIQFGFDTNGYATANQIIGVSTSKFNYASLHPITYISSAFLGYRGSINWLCDVTNSSSTTNCSHSVSRTPNIAPGFLTNTTLAGTNSANMYYLSDTVAMRYFSNGGKAIADNTVTPGLVYNTGFYSQYKFNSTSYQAVNNNSWSQDDSNNQLMTVNVLLGHNANLGETFVNQYCGIGPDYGVHFFCNVPAFFMYGSVPTPV